MSVDKFIPSFTRTLSIGLILHGRSWCWGRPPHTAHSEDCSLFRIRLFRSCWPALPLNLWRCVLTRLASSPPPRFCTPSWSILDKGKPSPHIGSGTLQSPTVEIFWTTTIFFGFPWKCNNTRFLQAVSTPWAYHTLRFPRTDPQKSFQCNLLSLSLSSISYLLCSSRTSNISVVSSVQFSLSKWTFETPSAPNFIYISLHVRCC